MNKLFVALSALTLTVSGWVFAVDMSPEAIKARIQPVGQVALASAVQAEAATEASSGAASGESIYTQSCAMCHTSGAAGAPKLGDQAQWADRIAKGNDVLYANAINGINAMPPRGTCAACSDDDIKAAVDYMVGASQ